MKSAKYHQSPARQADVCLSAIALLASSMVTSTAGDSAASPVATAAPKPKASAGLVNDWLRDQSADFKPWDLGGQFRVRYELFDDCDPSAPTGNLQASGIDNDNNYLWLRAKLHLGFTSPWIKAYAEGRSSHAIGDEDPRNTGQDAFDLHQAFLGLGNSKEFPLTAKIGRQEMNYGDQRLIGASDWSNTGRVFDTAKLRYENEHVWIDAFGGRVVESDDSQFNQPNDHDWLLGVYAGSKTLIPIQETELYVLSRNTTAGGSPTPRDILSLGARVKSLPGKLNDWDYFAEVVGQVGSISQGGQRRDQRALASAAGVGYTWSDFKAQPRLDLEYDFSTGDGDSKDQTSETLDNLYPTNHGKYGIMDLVGWRNIHDVKVGLTVKPIRKLTITVDCHWFWLADTHDFFYPQSGSGRSGNGYGRNPNYDNYVGSEVDIDASYAVTPWAGLRAGYGHFFSGSYVDTTKAALGGSTDGDWFYLQATLNF